MGEGIGGISGGVGGSVPPRQNLGAVHATEKLMGHSVDMLRAITDQTENLLEIDKINKIYNRALPKLQAIEEKLKVTASKIDAAGSKIDKKVVKSFAALKKEGEAECAKILTETQAKILKKVTKRLALQSNDVLKTKYKVLAKGDLKSKIIIFFATLIKVGEYYRAYKALQSAEVTAKESLINRRIKAIMDKGDLTEIQRDRLREFNDMPAEAIRKRSGVWVVGSEVRILPSDNLETTKKQLQSFMAQRLSDEKRVTLTHTVKVDRQQHVSQQVPLNREFDARVGKVGDQHTFEKIFGEKGLSSANRQESHIINGYLSTLGESFKVFRHGILSSKLVKDKKIRAEESEKAAEELLKAALLQTLAQEGKTLKDAAGSLDPVQLNLSSVSLVTPDHVRYFLHGSKSERSMLKDQIAALEAVAKKTSLEIGGHKIPVNIVVNTFNFGVNKGAVKGAVVMGHAMQYEINQKGWSQLKAQFDTLYKKTLELTNHRTDVSHLNVTAMSQLIDDIDRLMAHNTAYLSGGNQYEIGAKIINLGNLMTELAQHKAFKMNLIQAGIPLNYNVAMNCMSGKDRTGVMDGVAKALHALYLDNGAFPTHEQLSKDPQIKAQFGKYLLAFLKESGSLEITLKNTGFKGYKVTEEANVAGLPLEDFLPLVGLSKATKS